MRAWSRFSFRALVVLTLALCIGANLVVFTVVKALWLRPNGIPDPDRVVLVSGGVSETGNVEGPYSSEYSLTTNIRTLPVFEAVAGQVSTRDESSIYRPHVLIDAAGHEVDAVGVTWQYFAVLGLDQAIKGRDFTSDDDKLGMPVTGIISDRLWRSAFRGSNDVINTTVAASPRPIHIVGVAPPDFHGARLGEDIDLWIPRFVVSQVSRAGSMEGVSKDPGVFAFARLKDGVPVEEAQRALYKSKGPKDDWARPLLVPLSKLYGTLGTTTTLVERWTMQWLAAAGAAIVLVAGCVTLMALIVVYYERRRHELAIRMALGCSQARITRSLILELSGLGLAGILGAAAITVGGRRLLPAIQLPGNIDLSRFDLSPDWRVACAGLIAVVATMAIAAWAPLRRATRHDLVTELGTSSSKSTTSSLKLRRDIVGLQVAVTVIALMAAGPFVRTIVESLSRQPRFDVSRVLFAKAQTGSPLESTREQAIRQNGAAPKIAAFLDELRALPGVSHVSLGASPIGPDQAGSVSGRRIFVMGRLAFQVPARFHDVGPTYFSAMGMTMVHGRPLTDADATHVGEERPVVVSLSFAATLWPDRPAIDRVFGVPNSVRAYRVVGVVSDIALGSLHMDERRAVYLPVDATAIATSRHGEVDIVLRSDDPGRVIEEVRRRVATTFPEAIESDVATGDEIISRDYGRERLGAWFFTGYGLVALALGVGGVFGLVAYVTEARRREMGIRLALGARHGQLMRLILGSGFVPVLAGTAAGLGVSVVLGRVISTSFLDVGKISPWLYALVTVAMAIGATAAGVGAALRVRHVSPSEALRSE